MIIPDDDKKEIKSSLKILYIIALLFLLLIVFSLGYFFRHELELKCDEKDTETVVVNNSDLLKFREIVLYKDFVEMNVEFIDNQIINIKIEKNQNDSIVFVQNEKLFTLNSTEYINSVFVVDNYFILPVVDTDNVTFYIFDNEGNLINKYSSNNKLKFKKYEYIDGRIFVDAKKDDLKDICSLNFFKDEVVTDKFELLYIEDGNFVFRSDSNKKIYLSELISRQCK